MPTTTNWDIEYPNGTVAPNVPAVMQAQAQSVEAALDRIALSPLIVCAKNEQILATPGVWYDIKWDAEVFSQKVTHTVGDSTFICEEAGLYRVATRVAFSGGATTGTIQVAVNGIQDPRTLEDEAGTPTAWGKPSIDHYVRLEVGDALKIVGYTNQPNTSLSSESNFSLAKVAGF